MQAPFQPQAFEQMDLKQQIPSQTPFHMSPQFSYQPQLTAAMQPVFFHPLQYMTPTFRSSIDIFGPPKTESSANWGTNKMGVSNPYNTLTIPLDSTSGASCPSPCPTHLQYPTFTSPSYAVAMSPFEYPASSTHNTYYITNVNNSTFCANTATPISPSPTPIPTPIPTPLHPPTSATSEPTISNVSHTKNYNFTYNTTYNCYDNDNAEEKSEFDFSADLHAASESARNDSMDASVTECDTSMQAGSQAVERSEEAENETDDMDEDDEERNDSDSDYEDEGEGGHSHRINILVYPPNFPLCSTPFRSLFDEILITPARRALPLYRYAQR
jgi:hypothetical protein